MQNPRGSLLQKSAMLLLSQTETFVVCDRDEASRMHICVKTIRVKKSASEYDLFITYVSAHIYSP